MTAETTATGRRAAPASPATPTPITTTAVARTDPPVADKRFKRNGSPAPVLTAPVSAQGGLRVGLSC